MRKMMMYAQVLLGNALIALAFGSLIIPQGFASGGTTGLAVFEKFPITSLNPAFASVLAGVMLGAGTKLILEGGGSSGDFDVIGAMLNRKCSIPGWVVVYSIDALLIAGQMISGGVMAGIYGIVVTVVACAINALVPFMHVRHNQTKLA